MDNFKGILTRLGEARSDLKELKDEVASIEEKIEKRHDFIIENPPRDLDFDRSDDLISEDLDEIWNDDLEMIGLQEELDRRLLMIKELEILIDDLNRQFEPHKGALKAHIDNLNDLMNVRFQYLREHPPKRDSGDFDDLIMIIVKALTDVLELEGLSGLLDDQKRA